MEMSNLKRCTERKVVAKKTVFDFAEDGEISVQCGRIEGHTGTHSFIVNRQRIGEKNETD